MKAADYKVGDKVLCHGRYKGVVHALHASYSGGVRVMVQSENGSIGSIPYWELKKIDAE